MTAQLAAAGTRAACPAAAPQRIAIVTDAWLPQMNGVVRTLTTTCDHLRAQGHEVLVISPDQFSSVACPTYPEIRLALALPGVVGERLRTFAPEAIHIATEGPLGMAARGYCTRRGIRFTTAYHTQFPDYLASRTHLPAQWFWRYIEWFHRPARRVLVATESISAELRAHGLPQLHRWSRGVDLAIPAARSWWGTARRSKRSGRITPRCTSSVAARDAALPDATPERMSSSSPAGPTPSAW